MKRVATILDELRARGFAVHTDGTNLYVSPRAKLKPSDVKTIQERKPELLARLESEALATYIRKRLAQDRAGRSNHRQAA
ncbi:MAG: hypothetical protein HY774_09100 [Acidobacteria bacterium]|nr:hypothetical protein [Acidobacteriota bacterium]